MDWEYVKENPFAKIKIKKRKPEVRPHLPPGSFTKFLMSIEDLTWRRVFALYCATGRRRKELLALKAKHVDMSNLLAGTGIATIFVDQRLCILRFTPAATRIINLLQVDIGRPVGHIVSNMFTAPT